MEELKKLAQMYEDKADGLRINLQHEEDKIKRFELSTEIMTYQTVVTDIYTRILEIQKQN